MPMVTNAERKRLGSEIARVRKKAGMSQVALGEALDVHRTTVARWEGGVQAVDGTTLAKLEQLFSVRLRFESVSS